MNQITEQPTLTFFRSYPENLMSRPPLCSSLQSLESCFYMISLNRFPHALTSCASSVESAMKSALNKSVNDYINATDLYNEAIENFPNLSTFHWKELQYFRNTRNRIVHFGYSPKDDEETAIQLLKTGLPFLSKCYQEFFEFDLMNALIIEFSKHLNFALEAFKRTRVFESSSIKYYFSSFAHLIRWNGLKNHSMSTIESQVSEVNRYDDLIWEARESWKSKIESAFSPNWICDCPVCEEHQSFICELDNDLLTHKNVFIKRGMCANCDLIIRKEAHPLIDVLFEKKIAPEKDTIIKEYGIK